MSDAIAARDGTHPPARRRRPAAPRWRCAVAAAMLVCLYPLGPAPGMAAEGEATGDPRAAPDTGAGAGVPGRGTPRPAGGSEAGKRVQALTDEAVAVAERLVADFPDDADALVAAGNAYRWLGRPQDAAASWRKALEREPGRADVHFAMSRLSLKEGRLQEAAAFARRALKAEPRRPGVRHTLAAALLLLGKAEEALPLLEEEIRLAPRPVETRYLLGRACFQTERYREAKRHYQRVLTVVPNHKNASYGLVRVCLRLGETDRAAAYRKRFGAIKQQDLADLIEETTSFDDLAGVRSRLAGTLTEAGVVYRKRARTNEGARLLRRAADLAPQAVACRRELAALSEAAGRYDDALRLYGRLAELEPGEPVHRVRMGGIHLRRKAYGEAEQALREARRAAPERAIGHRALAHFYLTRNRNLERALELARWAVRLEPTAVNYFVFSRALDATGDRAAALEALRKARDLDPDNRWYQDVYARYKDNP